MATLEKEPKNIAVIQTAFLGDVLLCLHLIYHLKNILKSSKIDLILRDELADVGKLLPDSLNKIIPLNKRENKFLNSLRLIKQLRSEKYDLIISPHRSFRTALIAFFAKGKYSISFDKSSLSFLYNKQIVYKNNIHEIERNLDLLYFLPKIEKWRIKLPVELVKYESEKLDEWTFQKKKIIALAPGTEWYTKKYPIEYFIRLSKKLLEKDFKLIIIGGKKDTELGEKIISQLNDTNNIINFIGKLTIPQSVSVIDRADLIICNDSAPTHLASFTNAKILTIYGSTIPEFGFAPYRENDEIIQIDGLKCKPCGIHGRRNCPEGHFDCMMKLTPEHIFEKVINMLSDEN